MMNLDRTAEKCMERLNELLLKKKALLSGILEITRKQFLVLSENSKGNIDSLDKLEGLINEKQTGIDEIDRIDEEFERYYASLKSALGLPSKRLSASAEAGGGGGIFEPETGIFPGIASKPEGPLAEGAKKLKDLTGEILAVITEISGIEKENSSMSQSILGQIGNEIKKINQGKKADNAYKPTSTISPSYFIDKKK